MRPRQLINCSSQLHRLLFFLYANFAANCDMQFIRQKMRVACLTTPYHYNTSPWTYSLLLLSGSTHAHLFFYHYFFYGGCPWNNIRETHSRPQLLSHTSRSRWPKIVGVTSSHNERLIVLFAHCVRLLHVPLQFPQEHQHLHQITTRILFCSLLRNPCSPPGTEANTATV